MSNSEQKESKIDVEDDSSTKQDALEEEKEIEANMNPRKTNEINVGDSLMVPEVAVQDTGDDIDADADGDSEAETLIQSPEKKRNSVAEGATVIHPLKIAGSETGSIILANTSDKENVTRKRKRSQDGNRDSAPKAPSHHSSPLSSPVAHSSSEESGDSDASNDRLSPRPDEESETHSNLSSMKKRRRRPSEATSLSSHKRKRGSLDLVERRETRSATYPRPSDDEKSASPEPISKREHRRGASTQLTTGEFERRKRGRPPLINTRRNRSADRVSNSSEESGPRTGRARPNLHKLASADHDTMSPAKVGPRKWKDKNGRTHLARACANNDLEAARAKLAERVEDLNVADNAGNTPLQIASLEGFDRIVEFLLQSGADVNMRNVDKDTPLIDAVENGHIEVIKLLLKYGANPRMGNAKGDEPYELVHPDDDARLEIRELLTGAKDKDAKKTPGVDSFDVPTRDGASSRAASAASPRDSPPTGPRSPPAFGNRRRTGRSESTRNDLLWQANTQENLAKLAGKGDVQGVASILSILEKAETEALIAAAKAGHEEVLQLLIAMGKPNPDPDPVRSSKLVPGYNTPMLAAIGRGHPDVVKLLANQSGFDPTRRHKEKTYFELAEQRHGDRWEEEMNILKQAYERFKGKRFGSPRKTREAERPRPRRRSSSVSSAVQQMPSPAATYKSLPVTTSPRERRKASDPVSDKSSHSDAVESSVAVASDVDQRIDVQKKGHRTRRSQSDLPPFPSLEQEPTQKRRRLVTGKEHRSRHTLGAFSDQEDEEMSEVKQEERPSIALKRTRVSSTPEPPGGGKDRKKRRTVLESSPDDIRPRVGTSGIALVPSEQTKNTGNAKDDGLADVETAVAEKAVVAMSTPKVELSDSASDELNNAATTIQQEQKVEPNLSEAAEESDEPYSPPPAVAPPLDDERTAKHEEEKAQEEPSSREAIEAEARAAQQREELLRVEEELRAQEKAAENARNEREAEEKRKEAEIAQRQREEEEKQYLIKQAEIQRIAEEAEQERRRLDTLPIVLARTAQMIDDSNPFVKSADWLGRFLPLYSVRTRQLDLTNDVNSAVDEEWIPNFQAASLLSKKDLQLREFVSFTRRPVSAHERQCLWRVARLKLAYDFNHLAPISTLPVSEANEVESVAKEKFMSMSELFWVKVS